MENIFQNLVYHFYRLIFREEINEKANVFLKNISYVALGTIIASLFTFVFNILAGRILGPAEYGKFALISSISMFLYIPMLPGLNVAVVKYVSEKNDFKKQSKIISTTIILALPLAVLAVLLYFVFAPQLSKTFSISPEIFALSVLLAFFFTLYTLAMEITRAIDKMKEFAFLKIVCGITLLGVFLFFIFSGHYSFKMLVFSTCVAYLMVAGISLLLYIHKYFKFSFDKVWAKKLTKYSLWVIIGSVTFVIYTSFDKILINKYLAFNEVGIYGAYQFASISISALIFGIFNTVFFPVASRHKDKKTLLKKMNSFLPYLILLGTLFVFFCEFVILKLYGNKYPFNPLWALLLSIACVCIFIDGFYSWTLASVGEKGIKITSVASIFLASVNIILDISLIPIVGVTGAIIGLILAFLTSIASNLILGKKYLYA
jgi:O-antigen/teichoic acid export membrane protein